MSMQEAIDSPFQLPLGIPADRVKSLGYLAHPLDPFPKLMVDGPGLTYTSGKTNIAIENHNF